MGKVHNRKKNLEVVLSSQNCVFETVGIGYNSFSEKKVKKFDNFFSKNASSDISLTTCNYVWEKGMFLKVAKLENMMYLRDLWNGSQRDQEKLNHVGPNLSKGTIKIYFASHKEQEERFVVPR